MGDVHAKYDRFSYLVRNGQYEQAAKMRGEDSELEIYIRFRTHINNSEHGKAAMYLLGKSELKNLLSKKELKIMLSHYENFLTDLIENILEKSSKLEKTVEAQN